MGEFTNYSRNDLIKALNAYASLASAGDKQKDQLLYDLPLHQIELEIQNRDLFETQKALESARDQYAELYDFAPVGYLSFDQNGVIRNLNLTAASMLGKERSALFEKPFGTCLSVEDKKRFFELLRHCFDDGPDKSADFRLAADPSRTLQLECQIHTDGDGTRSCLSILSDVTPRVTAENTLLGERNFLQNLINSIEDTILVIGTDYKVLRMNSAARKLADASGLDDACLTCHKLFHQKDRPCSGEKTPCPLASVLVTGQPSKVVHQHESANGTARNFEVAVSPLHDDRGKLVGAIEVHRDISQHLALLDEIRERELSYAHLAQHDPLTGLPNRVLFTDRLSQAMHVAHRNRTKIGVLFVDLDRFKEINDSLDHSSGDIVLQQVADRLRTLFREDDTIARMGGDEFTVILSDIGRPDNAGLVANKILDLFSAPFEVSDQSLYLGASIGISVYPDHGSSVDELVRNADTAMYQAKGKGKNTFHYYSKELTEAAVQRIALVSALHDALQNHELVLHYQPQFDLDTREVRGIEALVRWERPHVGLVSPDDFISVAEETGTIVALGEYVLRKACTQMVAWKNAGLVMPDVAVSVNISNRQFDQPELVDMVIDVLRETGLDPANLELEITESTMMRSAKRCAEVLKRLRDMGVRVSIDDFGAGYSSLSCLKLLPITRLKIDRSFVDDLPVDADDAAIASAIIILGRTLSLDVLAEGIETEEQRHFLLEEGCHSGQGNFFSRPLPVSECEEFLQAHPR